MPYAFNSHNPNLNSAVNQLNRNNNIFAELLGLVKDTVDNIVAGAGSIATSNQVEMAVNWAIDRASNFYVTYSQSNRNLKNTHGLSYDCSSFIITAFYAAGLDINATYTGDMISGFTAAGFKWIPGSEWYSNQLKKGDILLNIANHTQMYIGQNQDVNCGSTPARVQGHSVDNYGRGWDGILRYE